MRIILDPTCSEPNRGSFCYLPYILHSAWSVESGRTLLMENFTFPKLDTLSNYLVHNPNVELYVALWTETQIDLCVAIHRFSPIRNIKFFGYTPYIKEEGLPLYEPSEQEILKGIERYPLHLVQQYYSFILLSDCDMHLRKYGGGQVYPMFTSYGCPRNCSYCPTSVNCGHKRIVMGVDKVIENLKLMYNKGGICNIHFTDEDFFYDKDRAYEILRSSRDIGKFQFIAMAHLQSIEKFVDKFGAGCLKKYGMKVIEIGLETADPDQAKRMHKVPHIERYKKLWEEMHSYCNIFWLCLTFFPGETVQSLRATGKFLEEYGYKKGELFGRIATNSTVGGLGQFFQLYPDTPEHLTALLNGHTLKGRASRLIPSYIPDSFSDSKVSYKKLSSEERKEVEKWTRLYNLQEVGKMFEETNANPSLNLQNTIGFGRDWWIFNAILARLGYVEEVKDENN